jgi:PAS domain S-box-containing protein
MTDMAGRRRQFFLGYAVAFGSVLVAAMLKLLIREFVPQQQAFLLFFVPIAVSTWYGGIGPGLVSAMLSALIANYFFLSPYFSLAASATSIFQLLLFFLESLGLIGITSALRERRWATAQTAPEKPQNAQDEALALLDSFQVNAPIGIAFLDNDLRYIRINYAMAETNGLTPAAHVGKLLQDIQPGLTPEMLNQIRQVVTTGKPLLDQEFTINKPTMLGYKTRHLLTSYYRIRGADGQPLGVGIVMMDVTQHKEAELALRESEARFRIMADNAPVLIWLAGADRQRTYFNKVWLDFTGHTMEEDTGSGWKNNVHPDDLERFLEIYDRAFDTQTEYHTEYRLRRHDGEYRWIFATGIPRYSVESDFIGFIGSCVDITERKQIETGQEFLAQSSVILAASLDYEATLASVAQLAVPTIADWCAVDILSATGSIERLAVAHVDPEKVKWAYELQQRYPVDPDAPTGLPNVLRTGQGEFYPEVTEEMIEGAATDGETYEILRQIGFTSVIITPLIARGRTLGALTLVTTESRRHLTEADVALAEQLASRAAIAVDNARLYREAQQERRRFQITLTSVGDAVIATDKHGNVTFLNQVAQTLTGWQEADAIGKPLNSIFNIVNEYSRQIVESPVDKVLREGRVVGLANHTVLISRLGEEVPIDDSGAPIPAEDGSINGVVLVFRDVSERKRIEQRQHFLNEATKRLIESIDYETTLQQITRLAVPTLADWAVVYLLGEDGYIQQAAMHHIDPEVVKQRQALVRKYSPVPTLQFGYPKVIRTGEAELLPEVTDEILQAAATNEEHLEMLRALNYKSSVCVPLRNTSGVFGAFTLVTLKGGRTLNDDDLELTEELGRVISLAIENARLYRDAKGRSAPDENGNRA